MTPPTPNPMTIDPASAALHPATGRRAMDIRLDRLCEQEWLASRFADWPQTPSTNAASGMSSSATGIERHGRSRKPVSARQLVGGADRVRGRTGQECKRGGEQSNPLEPAAAVTPVARSSTMGHHLFAPAPSNFVPTELAALAAGRAGLAIVAYAANPEPIAVVRTCRLSVRCVAHLAPRAIAQPHVRVASSRCAAQSAARHADVVVEPRLFLADTIWPPPLSLDISMRHRAHSTRSSGTGSGDRAAPCNRRPTTTPWSPRGPSASSLSSPQRSRSSFARSAAARIRRRFGLDAPAAQEHHT